MPFNLKDKDNNLIALSFTLLIRPPLVTFIAFTMPKIARKKHSTSTRIKAIYILKEKILAKKILAAIRVFRTRTYALATVVR
jgi:hypothetical protein